MVESLEICDGRLELAAKASPKQCYRIQPSTPGSDEHGDRSANVSSDNTHRINIKYTHKPHHIPYHIILCHFKLQNSLYLSGPRMTHNSAHYFHDYSNFTSKVSMFISPCFYNPPLTFLVTVKHLNFCTMSSRRKQTGKSII